VRKILSIDGGGIRGVIPAAVLVEIEARTQKPVAELFDLIAGTSTGGLLALGLTKPSAGASGTAEFTAQQMLELYEREGSSIFERNLWHRFMALDSVLEEKYPSQGIERVLAEYFGDAMLSESLTELLVTSYDIERRTPFFFRRSRAREREGWDWQMRQAARATSAAPTYFEPVKLQSENSSEYYALVDGGVFANNPAMCAYAEARTLWPDEEDFLVVSLGTGELTRRIPYDVARGWGLAKWAQPILGVVFDGVSDTVDFQLAQLCRDEQNRVARYLRMQVRLEEGSDDMDNATRGNIHVLRLLAEELVRAKDVELAETCEALTS
jgi:patatin-like phospholipase/acyl hydrolase